MGSLDMVERPNYFGDGAELKSPDEDPSIALTDIYQFLLFNGEIVKEDPKVKDINTDFDSIKEQLVDKITRVQKTTAEKVVKRIYK